LFLFSLLLPQPSFARQVTVPLQLDHEFLRQLLVERVYTGAGTTAEVWKDSCGYLRLSEPMVDSHDGRLRIVTAAESKFGMSIAGHCMPLHSWAGMIEALEVPRIESGIPVVRFRVVDSSLVGVDEKKGFTGNLWDLIKSYVHPRLEEVTVDLNAPLNELAQLLPLFLSAPDVTRTRLVLEALTLTQARVDDQGLALDVQLDLTDLGLPSPAASGPEPTLTAEELQRWEVAWHNWDAFLTFIVVRLGREPQSEQQLRKLRDVFLAARYDLAAALVGPTAGGDDPVRRLFLRTWSRLRPVLRELSDGLPGASAMRYLSFIAATDALRAIDDIGADVGVEISADGLRRLARIVDPATSADPLQYDTEIDPELRRLLGFGDALPTPTPNSDDDQSGLGSWFVAPAFAAEDSPKELRDRLGRWAPTAKDAREYLPLVLQLLDLTRVKSLVKHPLEKQFQALYRPLLLAAAWQESCWRQFVRVGGKVQTLTSSAGSIGIMQVNQHVWRGLYDVRWLRDDIAYNAAAGSEILMHYLTDYAIAKGEHTRTGNVDNLARATYAAYNGGPGHLRRYRSGTKNRQLRQIDESFWRKYRKVKGGDELAVAECYNL
jgi:hypothetical protein